MKLFKSLSLIQEASALILPDLKKVMQKDKRVSPFLKRDSTFADLEDPKASLETLKFYMLNNPNVIAHVKSRFGVGKNNLSKWNLDQFRKARDLEEKQFDLLKMVVQDIFKDHASLSRGTISASTMKELKSWANNSGRYYNLTNNAQRELDTLDALKPSKPIVIYRGLLFMERDFTPSTWDESEPNGLKFAKAIRANKKEVDLTWDRPSSWSKEKGVAQRFAMFGPASSSFAATFQALSRKGAIDGEIGYIVAMLVDPNDVLVDFDKAKATIGQFEYESEVIVKPGKYHCRIVKKFTPAGEVPVVGDDSASSDVLTEIKQILNDISTTDLSKFSDILNLPTAWGSPDFVKLLKANIFKQAVVDSTTTEVIHLHDRFINASKKLSTLLKNVNREAIVTNPELNDIYVNANAFNSVLAESAKFNSAEEYRAKFNGHLAFERAVLSRKYFYSADDASDFKKLGDVLGVKAPSEKHIHMTSKTKQAAYIDDVTDAFLRNLNLTVDDGQPKVTLMISLLKKSVKNINGLKLMQLALSKTHKNINKQSSIAGYTV